jgi:hypothetical protein
MIWIEFKGIAGRKVGCGMAFNCNIMNKSTELSFLGGRVLYMQTRLWTLGVSCRVVCALLSMLNETERYFNIGADYTKNTFGVYREIVVRYIKQFERLDILNAVELHSDMVGWGESWVPNWSVRRGTAPIKKCIRR